MYLTQNIEEIVIHYSDARRTIGAFILKEGEKIFDLTLNEIAEATFTSKTTIVRFAKGLGFDGWKSFLKAYAAEIHNEQAYFKEVNPNFPFEEDDSTRAIITKLSNLQVESILDTADLIDVKIVEKAVDILYNSNQIVLFGMSPNNYMAELFRRKLLSIGVIATIPRLDEEGSVAKSLSDADCAIVISYSGNNKKREPMRYIEGMLKSNVKLIGITSGGSNYISENVDCVFMISSRERLYSKISTFSTEQSIIHIFNILFACYFSKQYKKNLTFKIQNSLEFEFLREASLNKMKEE